MDQGYTHQVTAFFDDRARAQAAVERVTAHGIAASRITMVEGDAGTAERTEEKGFFDRLGDFFMPEEDRHAYAEGLRRGGLPGVGRRERAGIRRRRAGCSTRTAPSTSTSAAPPGAARAGPAARTGHDERAGTIELAEEKLKVGKRVVDKGRVRLRSYVVSEDVEADVDLRDEHVEVERRAVDRPAGAGEDVFRERSIEMEEHDEEAVVSKEARVTEEIDLKKTADVETRTVRDTVRHTEVEVDDERKGAGTPRKGR